MDSSDEVQNLTNSQAAGFSKETSFCDDFLKKLRFVGCAWRGVGEGIYLAESQAPAADSRKSAQNKRSEVSLEKPTPKAQSPTSRYKMASMTFCDSGFNARVPQAQHECKGSRFLGFVVRESALESTLSELKGLHPKAVHFVYALRAYQGGRLSSAVAMMAEPKGSLACRCSMSCAGGR